MKHIINFLVYPGVQPMDVIGPWEVIATWKNYFGPDSIEMHLVGETAEPIQCYNAIQLAGLIGFADAPAADYLIVPGGVGRLVQMNNPKLLAFIKSQAEHCKIVLSVCTGAFLLLQAGLLQGKKATTYWRAIPEFKRNAKVKVEEERIVKDGKIWTAGGISSGIDLAFALIAEVDGVEVAGQVQALFEYFPELFDYVKGIQVSDLPRYETLKADETPDLPLYIKKQINKA